MAWFKVDDGFYSSMKFLSIKRQYQVEAAGAWILCGTWSADKMTDGFVPYSVMEMWHFGPEAVEELVSSGLWDHDEEREGIVFHDWEDYQPTKAQLSAKSKTRAAVGSIGGKRSGEARRAKAEAKSKQIEANANPEPEPEPLITKVINNRATRINENWNLDTELIGWTKTTAPGLNIVTERDKFVDYWLSKAGKDAAKTDWARTWKNWVRSNVERNPKFGQSAPVDPNAWMIAKKIELS